LTGERGHYELAAGQDPKPLIAAIENFANEGGMITEQLWDVDDLPDGSMKRGQPTGAAMPLCWSHAEYISLVRSRRDGVCFDRVEPAFQRYVVNPVPNDREIWSFRYQLRHMPPQKTLRIIVGAEAIVVWSADSWTTTNKSETITVGGLAVFFVDLPTAVLTRGRLIQFTFYWTEGQRWEGKNWQITIE
jgi:glucoamylase